MSANRVSRSSPAPKTWSDPADPRSATRYVSRKVRTDVAEVASPESRRTAAAPATTGVEALVPAKQPGRYVKLMTQDAAEMSGLTRPSFVGPWEL